MAVLDSSCFSLASQLSPESMEGQLYIGSGWQPIDIYFWGLAYITTAVFFSHRLLIVGMKEESLFRKLFNIALAVPAAALLILIYVFEKPRD